MMPTTTASPEPILTVEGLRKTYPSGEGERLVVLEGLDLAVLPGEIVAVVGESGTGKSTLLYVLGTLDRPDEGVVRFRGEDVFRMDDEALAAFRNRSIGFVFQFHHLLPEFTALENVLMPSLIARKRLAEVRPRAMALLETLGLADRAQHRPGQLSGGEKQRVAIARALMNEPALVLADEPTGNLDTRTADRLHQEFLRLRATFRQTFVIVTHNLAFAALADRVLRLEQGRLQAVDPEEVAAWGA